MSECVHCGYCCTVGPCLYGKCSGEFDREHPYRCVYLTAEMECAKYLEILELEKETPFPMFGCGCSSTLFNEMRDAKLEKRNGLAEVQG